MFAILMNSMRHRGKQKLVKIEKKKAELICCRTCLSTEDLHPIFYGRGCEEKRAEELRLVTGLEIENNDGLPQKLCSKCLDYIIDALKFRRTSEKASQTLYSMGYSKAPSKTVINHTSSTKNSVKVFKNELNSAATYSNEKVNDDLAFDNTFDDNLQHNNETYESNKCKSIKAKNEPVLYKCNICSKEFRLKATCIAHMRFHTKFYVCEFCGMKCRNNSLLLEHKRSRHGLERIHRCAYCDYSAAQKRRLITHERLHTGEKPYICDHCGASFHRRSTIIQHIAIHLPEKNFQCEQCPKRFQSKKFLQCHRYSMHQPRRYSYACHVCPAHFTTTDKARKHLARKHGIARDAQGTLTRIPNIQKI